MVLRILRLEVDSRSQRLGCFGNLTLSQQGNAEIGMSPGQPRIEGNRLAIAINRQIEFARLLQAQRQVRMVLRIVWPKPKRLAALGDPFLDATRII